MSSSNPVTPGVSSAVGTADGVVADVGASFNQGTLNNNFRDLVEAINASRATDLDFDVHGNPYLTITIKIGAGTGPGAQPAGTYEVRLPVVHVSRVA